MFDMNKREINHKKQAHLKEKFKSEGCSMFQKILLVILTFISVTIFAVAYAEKRPSNIKTAVTGDATITIDGKSTELFVACNYGSANGLIISNNVFEAHFFNNPEIESRISYQTEDPNLRWSSSWLDSVTWKREGSRLTGHAKVRNSNIPSDQASETVNLMFDIRCEDMPVADKSTGTVEQPAIVKDVGDTAKDQSKSEILNETRKGVSDAFRSIFK